MNKVAKLKKLFARARIAVLVLFQLSFLQVRAAERVGDFALLDQYGNFHQLSYYSDYRAVVLLTQANGCSAVEQALADFTKLQASYQPREIEFMMLNAEGVDRDLVQQELRSLDVEMPVLMDDTQLVGELLGVRHAGEVIVLDPEKLSVLFRGPVGRELDNALAQVVAGVTVTTDSVSSSGCATEYAARDAHHSMGVSYVADVAPIIEENCAECHRQNSIAPFALDSHQVLQGWSPMIKEVVLTKRMPPGQIDPHVGNIINMTNLDTEEAQALIHWIDMGAPRDGNEDPLAKLEWPDSKWLADDGNEPDIIVQIPSQTIPATGVVDYINVYADIPIEKDVWIRGSEIVPGDYSVLHHVITRVVPPETANRDVRPEEGDDEFADQQETSVPTASLTGYVPGRHPTLEPGRGGLLRAGSRVAFQLHYTTSGREVTDHSELGIYLYPEGEVPEIARTSGGRALNTRFLIPAGAKDYEVMESAIVQKDAYLESFMPHMHYRGKRMKFIARYPDGTEEELLSVPNYQFNWQIRHYLEPKFVPAGTEILAVGAFDNSAQNSFNPDPGEAVDWGPQSWDEMFIGYMRWTHLEDMQ